MDKRKAGVQRRQMESSMNEKVEVFPAGFQPGQNQHEDAQVDEKVQKRRWLVLSGIFVLILVPALLFIWTRPDIYQSQAIIHFSYPAQLGREMADVPVEQINLNQQRLKSYRVLEQLSARLVEDSYIDLSPEQLNEMLATTADTSSRTINLYATSEQAHFLQPVIEQWIALYMTQLTTETSDDNQEQIERLNEKLVLLEQKIAEQQLTAEQFARENEIVSDERQENRTLNEIRGMSASLDKAKAQQTESTALLNSLNAASAAGETITHPGDARALDTIASQIGAIEAELKSLSEIYTEVYMQRDPQIVNKRRNLQTLEVQLSEARADSHARYQQETQFAVATANETVKQLQTQYDALSKQAQAFSEKLNTYNRQLESLAQLELQSQALQDQRTELEVQRPYEAILKVLESPFVPGFPIGPANQRDSLIALLVATVASVAGLFLYSFIVRRSSASPSVTSYTLVTGSSPGMSPDMQALTASSPSAIGHQPTERLENKQPTIERLLTDQELQSIYDAANAQTRLALGLMLHGVSESELVNLQQAQVNDSGMMMAAPYPREIVLSEPLKVLFTESTDESGRFNWAPPVTAEGLNAAIVNTAHDAGLAYPEQITSGSVRHSYLTFLVIQGAKLNDLAHLAGHTEPEALAHYRNVNRQQDLVEVDQIKTDYPLNW